MIKIRNKIYLNSLYGKYKCEYKDKHSSFPDNSYYRLSPKSYNKNDILFGTYDFQHYLYKHQHPSNCKNKKFLLINGWNAGHMSEIHVLSSYLGVAIESNRIAIFNKNYKSHVANGNYCMNHSRNWECYLEPLSNCSLTDIDIKKSPKYRNINQIERVVVLDSTSYYLHIIPKIIYNFLKPFSFSKRFYITYWTIQSVTFLFRINKRTYEHIISKIRLIHIIKETEYINVWVRHGNKAHEMNLIPTELYEPPILLFYKMWGKTDLYISSDDPDAISYLNSKYNGKYIEYERKNDPSPINAIKKGDKLTLNVIADIYIAISSKGLVGTLRSNIARIINELRMTVGYKLNSPFFEISNLNNSIIFIDNI